MHHLTQGVPYVSLCSVLLDLSGLLSIQLRSQVILLQMDSSKPITQRVLHILLTIILWTPGKMSWNNQTFPLLNYPVCHLQDRCKSSQTMSKGL